MKLVGKNNLRAKLCTKPFPTFRKSGVKGIPLSEKSIPLIELRTVETEYLGLPYTKCSGREIHGQVYGDYDVRRRFIGRTHFFPNFKGHIIFRSS